MKSRSQANNWAIPAVVLSALMLALLLGVAGAVLGWVGQVLFLSLLIPATLLLTDYRMGVLMLILVLPYAASPVIPQAGSLNIVNLLLAGVCMLYLLRMLMVKLSGKTPIFPVPRELLWFYLVPMTVAALIGSLHVGEIPQHFLALNKIEAYGLRQYWVSQYLKQMLVVVMACVAGAAVVTDRRGMRFAVAVIVSGLLFVAATVVLIAVTGISLEQLKDSRAFLSLLGRHNNEASVMLLGAFAPALFMRPFVQGYMRRLCLGVAVMLLGAGVILTFSRGGFLGLVAVVGMYVWHFRRVRTLLVTLAIVATAAAFAPDAVYERMSRGLDETSSIASVQDKGDELTAGRTYIWEQLAPEILRSPLWGRGTLSTEWSNYVKTSNYVATHPHNMYLEILMDMGLIGAATMFLFYRYTWRTFRRLGRSEEVPPAMRGFFLGASAGLIAMLVYGISNGHAYPAPEQIFFWVAVGLAIGYAVIVPAPAEEAVPRRVARRMQRMAAARARAASWRAT